MSILEKWVPGRAPESRRDEWRYWMSPKGEDVTIFIKTKKTKRNYKGIVGPPRL